MFQTTNQNLINRIFLELIAIVHVDRTVDVPLGYKCFKFPDREMVFFSTAHGLVEDLQETMDLAATSLNQFWHYAVQFPYVYYVS